MNKRVAELIAAASRGDILAKDDIEFLLNFEEDTAEAHATIEAAYELGFRAADGRGYVFVQIGIDALPCPENCIFCSFAACNSDVSHKDAVVPLEQIVSHAQVFAEAHVDLISLMATAAFPFEQYLEIVSAVRVATDDTVSVMANIGDLDASQACALKDTGVTCVYHALRLGEGRITAIAPEQRMKTCTNIKAAGLNLMCGVEPLWEDAPIDEVAGLIMLQRELQPFATGVCPLTISDGDCLDSGEVPSTRERVQQVAAITRLVCGTTVPIGGVGGVVWIDAGTDPRNRGYGSSPEHLIRQIDKKREQLRQHGWTVDLHI